MLEKLPLRDYKKAFCLLLPLMVLEIFKDLGIFRGFSLPVRKIFVTSMVTNVTYAHPTMIHPPP
jgi:hypothetical protein